ncbi:ribosome biogenesis ATPase RIX7 [Candida tropicalis MYA-3404]|uniref:Ribosome biogenesis ATPase RIX7 n=1 Tax=Candida tropicalis (strain ATCC MYA-3404 / T1) TaxID=294747 RepID=C5MAV5_CANTT|nr:ribosome biogenesis ATPase RIX7 [Candida tropicalis MYA-3404]EER32771.1 ribosome biogenesis ATPase RIX7 [Candida tropicalis MYA-3404]KAG4406598.1 hypothetical protein JTP64_003982 [Candida tropicalis]
MVFKISNLSSGEGNSIYKVLSNLPGLNIAGSIISGLLVAPITNTPFSSFNPSNSVNNVFTTSELDSDIELSLRGTKASNSSKNIIHGVDARALWKTCRTALSDSPTYLFKSSGPLIEIKFALDSLATAFASKVLPHPGGPHIKTPAGAAIPTFK